MHVAQFIHRYPPALGGAEAWAERLSRHLIAEGHKVTVWTTTALDLSAFTRTGIAKSHRAATQLTASWFAGIDRNFDFPVDEFC